MLINKISLDRARTAPGAVPLNFFLRNFLQLFINFSQFMLKFKTKVVRIMDS